MKIIVIAFAVLATVNLAAASADSTRFTTEATAILTDFETRIQAAAGGVFSRFATIVNTATGSFAAQRKALNDQLRAFGPAGIAQGLIFVNAIKAYQAAITPSVNLASLKTNVTIILNGFNTGIFATVSAGIATGAVAINQYPKAITCWDNNKAVIGATEANAALTFEQIVAYNLQDTADNVTPTQGQIASLGATVAGYVAASNGQLSFYVNNQASILAAFSQYSVAVAAYLNWQLQVILAGMADQLQSDIAYVQQEIPVITACFTQAMQ